MKNIEYDIPVFESKDVANLNLYSEKMATAIKTQIDKFGNPLVFQGIKESKNELDSISNPQKGDIYGVIETNKNYVWNGKEWIVYSNTIELDNYYKKEEIDAKLSEVEGNEITELIKNLLLEEDKKKYHIGKLIFDTENINPVTYLGFGTWELWGQGRVPVGINPNDSDFNTVEKTGGEKTHKLTVAELASHTHTFTGSAHTHTYAKTNSPTGGPSTNTSGSTVLTTNQIPSHSHILSNGNNNVIAEGEGGDKAYITTTGQGYRKTKIASTGGGQGHTHTLSSHTHTTSTTSTNTGSTTQGGTNSNTGSNTAHNNLQPYITCYIWKRIA